MINKNDMLRIFGDNKAVANCLGISLSAISKWPDPLPQRVADEVIGAAIRTRREIPPMVLHKFINPDLIISND